MNPLNSQFDESIDRRNTESLKYDFAMQRGKPEGLLPLWVADMDFRTPQAVIDALVDRAKHGIFGYSENERDYFDVVHDWFDKRFNWKTQPEWLVKTPGVVFAICAAIRSLTEIGDSVLIQQPVYYPFTESVISNERNLVVNQLVYLGGSYSIDFHDFEEKIIQNKVKLFILCSPHNPVGRVWKHDELMRMGMICLKHGVTVISDEIHEDFIYPGHYHLVFANLDPSFQDITVTCTAPTKTFNLAGLQISNIFISNPSIRRLFRQEINRCGYSQLGIMGIVATKAAYAQGQEWLDDLNAYLVDNIALLRCFLLENIPQVRLVEPGGTYLAWLDFSALGLSDQILDHLIVHQAGLWLDEGSMFGVGGEGFQRINLACPRPVLHQALLQLADAIRKGFSTLNSQITQTQTKY